MMNREGTRDALTQGWPLLFLAQRKIAALMHI